MYNKMFLCVYDIFCNGIYIAVYAGVFIFMGYGDILAKCALRANFRQLSRTSADKIWRSTVLTSGIKQCMYMYDHGFSGYPSIRDSAFAAMYMQ